MATCRVCTADIRWAETRAGERIPLDEREPSDTSEHRYRIVAEGERPIVEKANPEVRGMLPVDHRTVCRQPRII